MNDPTAVLRFAEAKVGSWVWLPPTDIRRYPDKWRIVQIDSENKASFIIGKDWAACKYDKKTGVERGSEWGRLRIMGELDKDDLVLIDRHRHRISSFVSVCLDAEKLREIAKIVGYDYTTKGD